jgi:hypothetical protein
MLASEDDRERDDFRHGGKNKWWMTCRELRDQ